AVERQERCVFIDNLARRSDVQLLHVTLDARDELPVAASIRHNQADGTNRVGKRFALNFRVGNTDLLLTLNWNDELACLRRVTLRAPFHARHPGHALHLAASLLSR